MREAAVELTGGGTRERSRVLSSPTLRVAATAAGMWIGTRVALALLTYFSGIMNGGLPRFGPPSDQRHFVSGVRGPGDLVFSWAHWDAGWYLRIARTGYSWFGSTEAFFPFFPLLWRGVGTLLAHPDTSIRWYAAGMVASNLAALVGFVAVAMLIFDETRSRSVAGRTVQVLAAYPLAFYLAAPFSEGLFLATASLSLLFTRRGWWWAAAGSAYLAGLTRPSAVILLLPMAWEYARQHGWWSRPAWTGATLLARLRELAVGIPVVGGVPLGILTYMAYLWRHTGNPLQFVASQKAWSRVAQPPWTTAQLLLQHLAAQPAWGYWQQIVLLDVALFLLFAAITLAAIRTVPFAFTLYMAGLLAVCVATPAVIYVDPITGTYRFLTAAVPVFYVVARWLEGRPALDASVLSVCLLVQAALCTFYLSGGWLS
jgi:hypothetical protein